MRIYVIIVTYNGMKWIEECLKTIISSNIPVEIIVIDNNSSDFTVEFIRQNFGDVILLDQKKNLGFGIANNIGISYALSHDADYVFLVNQDVFIEPETIEKLVKVAEENSEFGIVSPIHFNGKGNAIDQSFHYYISKPSAAEYISDTVLGIFNKKIYSLEMINAAAWLLPKKTLKIVGGFDPMFFLYGEDDNYCQRVLFHNLKIGITPFAKIRHDSNNNYKHEFPTGSDNYYDKFLTRVKVQFGNVNSDDFRKIHLFRFYFFKQSIFNLIRFRIFEAKVNWTKFKILFRVEFKENILLNRESYPNYLDFKNK